jgi:glycine/D-amino acid oxidase-like deaminating enzyme
LTAKFAASGNGWTFGEVLGKLMAWLELDEEQTLNLTLGLTEDGRFRDESGV